MAQNITVEDLMKEYDLTVDDVKLLIERHIVDKKFEEELDESWDTTDFDTFDKAGTI
tara:strand:+ start:490 stop:660 length:171 start_codon:yes stop_codon:yes gene_type:complete